jgi:hypothetical protein
MVKEFKCLGNIFLFYYFTFVSVHKQLFEILNNFLENLKTNLSKNIKKL